MGTPEYQGSDTDPHAAAVYLEHEGERAIDRVTDAVRTVPWSVTLLQLAWTAGPVTFVAMQGGSLLGFGTAAPVKNVLFFVAYTLIAGLVGLVTNILYKAGRSRRERTAHANLTRVIDQLPDLVFAARDLHLGAVDPDTRRRESAGLLLRKADLGPDGIAMAVRALTGDAGLAQAAATVELYRRAGLFSPMQDIMDDNREAVEAALSELVQVAPEEAVILRDRLAGVAPTPEDGVSRESNFIERVLAAMDEDRLALMTLRDAEDMLILGFECITGREIPVLTFSYRGRWRLARLIDEVESARNRYRVAQATVYNRLKALSDRLRDEDAAVLAASVLHTGAASLFTACRDHLEQRSRELRTAGGRASEAMDRRRRHDLVVALEIAESLEAAYQQVRRRYRDFVRALQAWEEQSARLRRPPRLSLPLRRRRGVRLARRSICLDDAAKLEVARVLADFFDRTQIRTLGERVVKGRPGSERSLGFEELKGAAIQVALALEPHIGLTRPEVQRAINSTNAIYLSGIEPGTSAATKAAWGAAMGKEIETDLGRAAERLALTLVRTYKVNLDASAIRLLDQEYGANPDRLATLAAGQEGDTDVAITIPDLQPVLEFDDRWRRALEQARQAVAR